MRGALPVLVVLSVAGCGALLELDRYSHEKGSQSAGAGGGGGSGGTGGAAPTACGAYAETLCMRYEACYPHMLEQVMGDVDTCRSREEVFCESVLEAGGTSWTEPGMVACATSIGDATCEGVLAMLFDVGPAACDPGPGTKAEGASCHDDHQCLGGFCKKGFGVCGECSSKLPANSACDHPLGCEVGLVCVAGTCVV